MARRNNVPLPKAKQPNLRYAVPGKVDPTTGAPMSTGVNPAGNVPAIPGNYGSLFQSILQKALALYNQPNPAANSLLNPGSIMGGLNGAVIDPNQVGQDAGLAYDTQIGQLNKNYNTTVAQNAQDLKDIQSWFDQVGATQKDAAASNAAELAAQLKGSGDAANAFINAIGGSDNAGSAGIANASDIAQAGLRGIGLSQSNFDNNMAGIIGLDTAQQVANEKTAGANRLQSIMDQIAQAKSGQTAAEAQAKDNAEQTKFGELGTLAQLKANLMGNLFNEKNSLQSQKLANLAGLSNTILGTALAGPQIQSAEIGNQLAAGNVAARTISNKGLSAQVAQVVNANGGAGNVSISALQPGTRAQVQTMLTSKGGQYVNASGGLTMPPLAIKAAVMDQLTHGMGFKAGDPQLVQFVNDTLNQILTPTRVSAWRKAHGA